MMYPLLTLADGTEIVHSDMDSLGKVKVYIERADAKDCFHHVTCFLPEGIWIDNHGFSDDELSRLKDVVDSESGRILELAARFRPAGKIGTGTNFPRTAMFGDTRLWA